LKGGMLISQMVGIDSRTTIDMDATVKSMLLTEKNLKNIFEEILAINLNDNVKIELLKSGIIREDSEYNGFRLMLEGRLDESRIPIKLDITTGDIITPKEIKYKFKLRIEKLKSLHIILKLFWQKNWKQFYLVLLKILE
jgi:hypothetical protein